MTLENQDTLSSENLKNKTRSMNKQKSRKVRFYLSFVTVVLFALVVQISYSAIFNISKIVVYRGKIQKAKELKHQAELRNASLKNEIKNFNSMATVESIARNNLKMAGDNEVLVIINTPDIEKKPKTKKEKLIDFFEKNIANKLFRGDESETFILPQD